MRQGLKTLVEKKAMGDAVSLKLSGHEIGHSHLKLAQQRDPNGARAVWQEHKIGTRAISSITKFL